MADTIATHAEKAADDDPPTRPWAYVLPSSLALKATTELYNSLGLRWRVYRLGFHQQMYQPAVAAPEKIRLGPEERPWSDEVDSLVRYPMCRRVVVMTYEQVSNVNANTNPANFFGAIVFDEAQSTRKSEENITGHVLRDMNAARRLFLTGTPLIKNPVDLHGYLSLIERPEWTEEEEHNIVRDEQDVADPEHRYIRLLRRYAECKRANRSSDEEAFPNGGDEWQPAVKERNGITNE